MKKALIAVLWTLAGPAAAQDAYVVGVSASMTGPAAGIYAPVVDAMKAYLDHVNARGGVNGRPVRLIVQDDGAEPSKAAANAKKLLAQDKVVMLINTSLSSTYAPMVAEAKRAEVPLYFGGSVCPKETYPPADPLLFCSSAFGANLDSQGALAFVKAQAKEPVRIGFAAMAIPIARAEIDYAEGLSKSMGMTPVEKQISPPPAPDYTPFATKLKDANPNWVFSWSPWVSQVRTFEAMRRLGWSGRYLTWAHLNAEEELARIRDGEFYVIGTNAFFQDDLPVHAQIRAVTHRANLKYPVTYLTEGFIAGLVIESTLKATPWPPTPNKVLAAMNNLKVDLKGLRGGALEWTKDNHFRTRQFYRVWRWDPSAAKIVRVQDWQAIEVKR
ncbi:MAG TPA: ABC transporter substrate-binding protein [Burkholderiales bacterium]|jgi:ABC-type branched-subunit amino acid transport system substrate-binding protein|nr:ABC transporter substrate-binding protein [Burkholderiales bacterium]